MKGWGREPKQRCSGRNVAVLLAEDARALPHRLDLLVADDVRGAGDRREDALQVASQCSMTRWVVISPTFSRRRDPLARECTRSQVFQTESSPQWRFLVQSQSCPAPARF